MEYTNQAPARYQGVMQAARQLMGRISMNLSYVHEGTVTILFSSFWILRVNYNQNNDNTKVLMVLDFFG